MAIYELDGQAPDLPADGRYWIADSAAVIGRVRLMTRRQRLVRRGAARRQRVDRDRRAQSQIQDNATLHTDPGFPLIIADNCVIGHNVVLHGCTIGPNSLIGMGAILLNGARSGTTAWSAPARW